MTQCPGCGHRFEESQALPGGQAGPLCPACGQPVRGEEGSALPGAFRWIDRYFRDLWQIITQPTRFFRRMPRTGGVSGPLAFALVTSWIGAAMGWLWGSLINGVMTRELNEVFRIAGDVADIDHPGRSAVLAQARDRFLHWFWGAGSVLLDPFLTAVSILFTSFFVWMGARLLVTPARNGAPDEIRYETALRIVCFGMSPAILAVIPVAGPFVSKLGVLIVTVAGAREVYRVSTGRAAAIALFPKLLFLAILMFGFLVIIMLMIKAAAMLF